SDTKRQRIAAANRAEPKQPNSPSGNPLTYPFGKGRKPPFAPQPQKCCISTVQIEYRRFNSGPLQNGGECQDSQLGVATESLKGDTCCVPQILIICRDRSRHNADRFGHGSILLLFIRLDRLCSRYGSAR